MQKRVAAILTILLLVATAVVALATLHAAWCAYTWQKFALIDYGLYTGAVWNTAHGHWFHVLDGESYLNRHLSFSLALFAPVYWVTNNQFAMCFMQWLCAITGAGLLVAAARRQAVAWPAAAAVALMFLLHPLTQAPLLSEFHGETLIFLALPWVYYGAVAHPEFAWVPLAFLCGLREEAGLFAAPILLALAVQKRSRLLGCYAFAALAYTALAIFVIYPLCNDHVSLFHRRGMVGPAFKHATHLFAWSQICSRGAPTLRILVLLLPLIVARPALFLAVCFVPLTICFGSPLPRQMLMENHYSAPVLAAAGVFAVAALGRMKGRSTLVAVRIPVCIFAACYLFLIPAVSQQLHGPWAGLMEPKTRSILSVFAALAGAAMIFRFDKDRQKAWSVFCTIAPLWLLVVTGYEHREHGFIQGSTFMNTPVSRMYTTVNDSGREAAWIARRIPKQGLLRCENDLCAYAAGREAIAPFYAKHADTNAPDYIFTSLDDLDGDGHAPLREALSNGTLDVILFDGKYVVARAAKTPVENRNNRLVLEAVGRTIFLDETPAGTRKDRFLPGIGACRTWRGGDTTSDRLVSGGSSILLPPGRYRAQFDLPLTGAGTGENIPGKLELAVLGKTLVSAPITRETQSVEFTLEHAAKVEPRVLGGAAPLLAYRVVFLPAPAAP